jgi:hypothetical protein
VLCLLPGVGDSPGGFSQSALRLGIDGRSLDPNGQPEPRVSLLGPLRLGCNFEV